MILVIDNYDSFTYNLVQYFGELEEELIIRRNDKISLEEIKNIRPDRIVISPGPGKPEQAGISCEVVRHFGGEIPILGVCLGHQAIASVYGGDVVRSERIMHGKTSSIHHDGHFLFRGLPNPFDATRYHSLIVKRESLPQILEVTAWTPEGEIMGLRHKEYAIEGVQFHPESILTKAGKALLKNFLVLDK